MYFQIFVAIPLETEQGSFRTLFVYLGGILFGAIGSTVINPTQSMVGASAGVYSLLLSHISHCVLVRKIVNCILTSLIKLIPSYL